MLKPDIRVGDITKCKVDAIVNAARPSLLGGGGVDGAIHAAAGPFLLAECERLVNTTEHSHGCFEGECVITRGYDLLASFVIHTVGPVWDDYANKEDANLILRNCYHNTIFKAITNQCKTLVFPAISTGAYGFPKRIAAEQVRQVLENLEGIIKANNLTISFIFFSEEDADIFGEAFKK